MRLSGFQKCERNCTSSGGNHPLDAEEGQLSPDNSRMEGFFGTMKKEMSCGRDWEGVSLEELGKRIDDCIEWHSTKRIRRSLGSMSPPWHTGKA